MVTHRTGGGVPAQEGQERRRGGGGRPGSGPGYCAPFGDLSFSIQMLGTQSLPGPLPRAEMRVK